MTAITINLDTSLAPFEIEALKEKLISTANSWINSRKEKDNPAKLEDFFGTWDNIGNASMTEKEMRRDLMTEKFGK